jgi:hypothetical protein
MHGRAKASDRKYKNNTYLESEKKYGKRKKEDKVIQGGAEPADTFQI